METIQAGDVLSLGSNGSGLPAGSVAHRLMTAGFNVNALRTNDVLRKEEWLLFDRTVVDVARPLLVAVDDLMTRNLRVPIPNAMGITVVQHETVSDMSDADIDMSGITASERDRTRFSTVNVPLPIVHKDFQLSLRNLESGRRLGMPLDTSMAAVAARKVAERIERIVFSGAAITSGGGTVRGYTDHPDRNTGAVTANWRLAATTGEQILTDIIRMIDIAVADNFQGPYVLYTSLAAYVQMLRDFKANSDKSTIQRLLEIPNLQAIRPTSQITGNGGVLVTMQSDVVEILDGIQPTTVLWESHGGMMLHFKVMAILVPRIKSDAGQRSGLVHFS